MEGIDFETLSEGERSLLKTAEDGALIDQWEEMQREEARSNSMVQMTPWFDSRYASSSNRSDVITEESGTYVITVEGTRQDLDIEQSGYWLTIDFSEVVDAVNLYTTTIGHNNNLKKEINDRKFFITENNKIGKVVSYGQKGFIIATETGTYPHDQKTPNLDPNNVSRDNVFGECIHMGVVKNFNATAFSKKTYTIGTNSNRVSEKNYGILRVEDLLKRAHLFDTGRLSNAVMDQMNPIFHTTSNIDCLKDNIYDCGDHTCTQSDWLGNNCELQVINKVVCENGVIYHRLHNLQKKVSMYVPLKWELTDVDMDNLPAIFPLTITMEPCSYGEIIKFFNISYKNGIFVRNSTWDGNGSLEGNIYQGSFERSLEIGNESILKTIEFIDVLRKPIKMTIVTDFHYKNPTVSTINAQNEQLTTGQSETYTSRPKTLSTYSSLILTNEGIHNVGPLGEVGSSTTEAIIADYTFMYLQDGDIPPVTSGPWSYINITDFKTYYDKYSFFSGLPIRTNWGYHIEEGDGKLNPFSRIEDITMRLMTTPGGSSSVSQNREMIYSPYPEVWFQKERGGSYIKNAFARKNLIKAWHQLLSKSWSTLLNSASIPAVRVDGYLSKMGGVIPRPLLGELTNFIPWSLQKDGGLNVNGGRSASQIRAPFGVSWRLTKTSSEPIIVTLIHMTTQSISYIDNGSIAVNNGPETL